MNNKILCFVALSAHALGSFGQEVKTLAFSANPSKISSGFFIEKVALKSNALPVIKITAQQYELSSKIISDSLLNKAKSPGTVISVERKKAYAFIQIPAFRKNENGQLEELKSANIEITEKGAAASAEAAGSSKFFRTTFASSVLENGNWQKLAIANRGMYKVDYDFVKNILGQSGTISSANIRLFGNGGTIMTESNAVAHPDDLTENAIEMYDGGDGNFGPGDYFLFYANGSMAWVKDSAAQQFHHNTNIYSDSSYYFITFNNGAGLRVANSASATGATTTVSTYNDYALHEKDLLNLGLFGKQWWGETMGFNSGLTPSKTISFPVSHIGDTVAYNYHLASAAVGLGNRESATFTVSLNGLNIAFHDSIYGIDGSDGTDPATPVFGSGITIVPAASSLDFNIEYQKNVTNAKAYIDYIEINTRRSLRFEAGTQLGFRDWRSVGPASVANFKIENATNDIKVWDISNPLMPVRINGNLSGGVYDFTKEANVLHEYIAADNQFLTPKYNGPVANQNLHGLGQADYLIVSHPEFIDAANKLADYHRNTSKLSVHVVNVNDVYNEFGSGTKDISAIRDFVRMFYDRAGSDESKMPKYLLLFGQASFDYKNIIPNNAKIVPTFETEESLSANDGHCTDDFFAFLDSSENINAGYPLLDIGVGRIPATNKDQAMAIVDKIIRYKSNEGLGAWRINNIFIGDNADIAGDHLMDADAMYETIEKTSNIYKSQKVYLDNMNIISTPGGFRCPDANKVINDNVYKGAFLINYSGHGSIYTLAHERVVTQDDYNSWNNLYKLPILITATCDFSRFDNPALQSAGEKIMLKSDGGAIALVTTTQVVYSTSNKPFNSAYLEAQFKKKTSEGWNTFGDAFLISKNIVISKLGDVLNSRKFALLGDPALVPNFPRYDVQTDSAQSLFTDGSSENTDSVKSLGNYRFYGSVRNDAHEVMSDFNGKVNITFFDKSQNVTARTGDQFILQNNIIYKGIATVKNGQFSFEFIAPKDINYEFGKGKISYYADNGKIDAAGADTSFIVGGFADDVLADNDAPVVRAFMNDSLFKDGGITGNNSILYAIITDNSGLNVSGNFVGHDLSAVLDDVIEAPYILNDYYETAPNTYKRGYVNFPINNLTDGIHTLKIKAWDVFNNSGEGSVRFEVVNGKILELRNIYNYPNPFSNTTHFVFEHNHPNEALTATIHIFNTTGGLVRTLEQKFTPTGSNSAEVIWDGTGNGGEKLLPGVYPYRIRIATEKNIEDLGYQKVILVR